MLRRGQVAFIAFAIFAALAAQTASAQTVLFIGSYDQLRPNPRLVDEIPPSSPQTLVTTPGAGTLVNGFTLPSRAFSQMFSFTTASIPGYPYLFGSADRYQGQATFAASYRTPNASSTINPTNVNYPYTTLMTPPGFIRQKFGPNGFGAPMTIFKRTNYTGLFDVGAGASQFFAPFYLTYGSCVGGPTCYDFIAISSAYHTTITTGGTAMLPVTNIRAFKGLGAPAMTGSVTISQPFSNFDTYTMFTAMDNRNAAGTSGTIQVISPRLSFGYTILGPQPAPGDGSGTVVAFSGANMGAIRTSIQVPEPAQIALISIGALGILGLRRIRRS